MLRILQNLTKVNRTIKFNKKNLYIVIHYVGSVSSAYNNTVYFKNVNRQASAHYFVDDNEIWQCVEDKNSSWHCGDKLKSGVGGKWYGKCTNSNSIGIEMCCFMNNGKLDISDKTIEKTIMLTQKLMSKYNIPVENVIRHYDVTNKTCPEPFVASPKRWNDFKARLVTSDNGYAVDDRVFIDIPVQIAIDGTPNKSLVDSNGYQFWIHSSVIKNNKVYGWGTITTKYNDDLYEVDILKDKFMCRPQYIGRKEF